MAYFTTVWPKVEDIVIWFLLYYLYQTGSDFFLIIITDYRYKKVQKIAFCWSSCLLLAQEVEIWLSFTPINLFLKHVKQIIWMLMTSHLFLAHDY